MHDRPSDRATPKFHGDDSSDRINALRREFEDWYVGAAFDYTANPIGSQNCDLQWRAWLASRLAAAPEGAQAVAMYQVRPRLGDGSWGAWREAPKRYFDDYEDNETGYPPDRWERRRLYTAPPSLDAEDGADSLMEAINCAARDLPDGWQIEIGVECGAGWVNLYEDGRHVDLELSTDDSLEEQVRDSIAFAIDAARAAEGKGS